MDESISSSSRTCSTDDEFHSTNYSEDVDSSWTAYFLLAFHDEEATSLVAPPREKLPADGDVRGSAFTVSASANNKLDKENNKVIKVKGEPMVVPKKEEDPLEDTASSPPLRLNGAQDVWNNTPSGHEKKSTTIARGKC
ncbi:hypothetical protein EJB05_13638, partial [Eragrostis curvula]